MADGWKPIERIQEGGVSLVSAKKANELIDAINALMGAKIVPIAGFGKMMAAGGQVIYDYTAAAQSLGGEVVATGDWPLKLVEVDTENVKVLLGTVSGFTPTDVNTNIDVSASDGTWAIYMHATISGTAVTAVEVLSDSGGSVPADDGNNSYRLIGEVDVASSVIVEVRPAMAWSQTIITCTDDTAPHDWLTGA